MPHLAIKQHWFDGPVFTTGKPNHYRRMAKVLANGNHNIDVFGSKVPDVVLPHEEHIDNDLPPANYWRHTRAYIYDRREKRAMNRHAKPDKYKNKCRIKIGKELAELYSQEIMERVERVDSIYHDMFARYSCPAECGEYCDDCVMEWRN